MLLEVQRAFKASVTGVDGAISRRLAVHRNNVQKSLVDVLAAAFPVVQRMVGEPFFYALARDFAVTHLPAVPQLSLYGADFAAFIATHQHAQQLAYLADVARLEWARGEAYFAVDAYPLHPQSLVAIDADALPKAKLSLHPAARLVSSRFPIHAIWAAHQSDSNDVAHIDMSVSENVLISRPQYQVFVRLITPADAAFVGACLSGATLNDATVAALGVDERFDLQAVLQQHLEFGTFSAVT